MDKVRLTIELDPELRQKLKTKAYSERMTMTEKVKEIVKEYVYAPIKLQFEWFFLTVDL